jgi:hypothetical protein
MARHDSGGWLTSVAAWSTTPRTRKLIVTPRGLCAPCDRSAPTGP